MRIYDYGLKTEFTTVSASHLNIQVDYTNYFDNFYDDEGYEENDRNCIDGVGGFEIWSNEKIDKYFDVNESLANSVHMMKYILGK